MKNSQAMADPTADPSSGDSSTQPYKICIAVDSDGKITVGVDPSDDSDDSASESGSGGSADDSDDSGMQSVKNIKEALTIALDIYKNAGQMTDGDSDFNSGYSNQSSGASPTGGQQ